MVELILLLLTLHGEPVKMAMSEWPDMASCQQAAEVEYKAFQAQGQNIRVCCRAKEPE